MRVKENQKLKVEKLEKMHKIVDDGFEHDLLLKQQKNQIKLSRSSGSCYLKEIQGFVYGGSCSRFWMFRKHFSSLSQAYYMTQKVPFYPWECITLQMNGRDVYLVIKNE